MPLQVLLRGRDHDDNRYAEKVQQEQEAAAAKLQSEQATALRLQQEATELQSEQATALRLQQEQEAAQQAVYVNTASLQDNQQGGGGAVATAMQHYHTPADNVLREKRATKR